MCMIMIYIYIYLVYNTKASYTQQFPMNTTVNSKSVVHGKIRGLKYKTSICLYILVFIGHTMFEGGGSPGGHLYFFHPVYFTFGLLLSIYHSYSYS